MAPPNKSGCCVFLLSPALLSVQLVYYLADLTEVLETTCKEVGPFSLKNQHAALVFRPLSFLHSKLLQPLSLSPSSFLLLSSVLPEDEVQQLTLHF